MRLRSLGIAAFAAAAVMQSCQPACTPPTPVAPVETPPPDISSITISGQGNGHGRGLSAWGAFGYAVQGVPWEDILGYYYGGTEAGSAGNDPVRVRLFALDGAPITAVISTTGQAVWSGTSWATLQAFEIAPDTYEIWAATTPACPGEPADGRLLATVSGPVTFTTPGDQNATAGGDVLGLCQPNGSVIHYRGSITALNDGAGENRTVNELATENYVRGVLPREVPPSWGNAAGGAGMNALRAMAVAARSFGHTQRRYGYAGTCDSSACQVYGGAASRPSSGAPATIREHPNTDAAAAQTAGVVRRWPDGRLVSTEYSATHGPYSAGGPFPVVDDNASNVPGNPLFTWQRTVDAAALESRYGLGNLTGASTEPDPGSPFHGVWGNRVVLRGTDATVVVSNLDLRNAFGFPSHGFAIGGVNR